MTIQQREPEAHLLWPGGQWLVLAMHTEDWAEHAACRGRDYLWDPPSDGERFKHYPARATHAATYCWWECPVRAQCQAYAAARREHGVWGGYCHNGRGGPGVPVPPAPSASVRYA
jgi:hypothetical protein